MTKEVPMADLHKKSAKIIRQVEAGNTVTITRNGQPVAELLPAEKYKPRAQEIWEQWSKDPLNIDYDEFREDVDRGIDVSLK